MGFSTRYKAKCALGSTSVNTMTVMMMMIVMQLSAALIIQSLSVVVSHAGNLPTPIPSADYTAPLGSTVASATSLNIASLLGTPPANNLIRFSATGLRFQNELRIECPSTAAAWGAVRLDFSVVDGYTDVLQIPVANHIFVTGVLTTGSSVVILGGNFTVRHIWEVVHLRIVTLQDGSIFRIEGAGVTVAATGNGLNVVQCTTVIVSSGSALSVIGNHIYFNEGTLNVDFHDVNVVKSIGMSIRLNGTVLLHNNTVVLTRVILTYLSWYLFSLAPNTGIVISGESALMISNNAMKMDTVELTGDALHACMFHSYITGALIVSGSSSLTMDGNEIHAIGISGPGLFNSFFVCFTGDRTYAASDNSTLAFTRNIITANNYSNPTSYVGIFSTHARSSGDISGGSVMVLSNNQVFVSNVSSTSARILLVVMTDGSGLVLKTSSSFSIEGNNITTNVVSSDFYMGVLSMFDQSDLLYNGGSTVSISSTSVMMHSTTVSTSSSKWFCAFIGTFSITAGNASFLITDFSVSIDGSSGVVIPFTLLSSPRTSIAGTITLHRNSFMFSPPGTGVEAHVADITPLAVGSGVLVITNNNLASVARGVLVKTEAISSMYPIRRVELCQNYVNGSLAEQGIPSSGETPNIIDINAALYGRDLWCTSTSSQTHTLSLNVSGTPGTSTLTHNATSSPTTPHTSTPTITHTHTPTVTPTVGTPSSTYGTVSLSLDHNTSTLSSTLSQTFQTITLSQQDNSSTASLTHSSTQSLSSSEPGTKSHPMSVSVSQSLEATKSELPKCPVLSAPCPYATTAVSGAANASTSALLASSTNTTLTSSFNSSSCRSGGSGLQVAIPFNQWSGGSTQTHSVRISKGMAEYFINTEAALTAMTGTAEKILKYSIKMFHLETPTTPGQPLDSELWAVVQVSYVGPLSRSTFTVTIDIPLIQQHFSCRMANEASRLSVLLHVSLAAAPPIPSAFSTVADVAVVAGVGTAVPSALVRAGVVTSLLGMLRCSEFDPEEEVGFINNPFGWGVGSEEMQYYRGSVVTVLIVMIGVSFVLLLLLFALRCAHGTFAIAINKLRLPSSPLVTVLLTSEMGISTGVSMILYEGSGLVDITLAVILIVPLLAYMVVYVMRSMSREYITVEPTGGIDEYERELKEENAAKAKEKAEEDDDTESDEDDEDIRRKATAASSSPPKKPSRSFMRRLMWYALEPTHDVVIRKNPVATALSSRLLEIDDTDSEMQSDREEHTKNRRTSMLNKENFSTVKNDENIPPKHMSEGDEKKELPEDMSEGERWLRHNYYFVSEKRWATFGAIEVVGGTIANILEGIPLTTSKMWLCIARPACILAIMLVTFALLLWKVPMAVRVQQWCAVVVIGGMLLASIIVTWNSVAPSEDLELAAGYVASFVMGASMILSFVEIVVMVMTHVPSVRALLSLPMHTLDSVIKHSDVVNKRQDTKLLEVQDSSDSDNDMHLLDAPLLEEGGSREELPPTPALPPTPTLLPTLPRREQPTTFTYDDPLGTPPSTDEDELELDSDEEIEFRRVVYRVEIVEQRKKKSSASYAKSRKQRL